MRQTIYWKQLVYSYFPQKNHAGNTRIEMSTGTMVNNYYPEQVYTLYTEIESWHQFNLFICKSIWFNVSFEWKAKNNINLILQLALLLWTNVTKGDMGANRSIKVHLLERWLSHWLSKFETVIYQIGDFHLLEIILNRPYLILSAKYIRVR